MKRFGRILFCFVPLLLVIALQNLASIPLCGITAIVTFLQNYRTGISPEELLQKITSLWTTSAFTLTLSAFYAVSALIIFGVWYAKKLKNTEEEIPLRHAFHPLMLPAMALLAVGLQYVTTYVMSFVGALRPDWMSDYETLIESAGFTDVSFLLVLYSCIIAPISEELIFRGVTLGYAKKCLPIAGAVCLQGVLFGVFHMNMIQGIYAAFLGLFLGYLKEEGGTVAISMAFHACFNICGVFLNGFLFYEPEQPFFFLLWLTVGVLLTFAGIFLFQHSLVLRDRKMEGIS